MKKTVTFLSTSRSNASLLKLINKSIKGSRQKSSNSSNIECIWSVPLVKASIMDSQDQSSQLSSKARQTLKASYQLRTSKRTKRNWRRSRRKKAKKWNTTRHRLHHRWYRWRIKMLCLTLSCRRVTVTGKHCKVISHHTGYKHNRQMCSKCSRINKKCWSSRSGKSTKRMVRPLKTTWLFKLKSSEV